MADAAEFDSFMVDTLRQAQTSTELLADLEALYRQVEQEFPSAICDACGRCCDFPAYGHRLYITAAEAALMLRHAPLRPEALRVGLCPYQVDRACHLREGRPLGCRVFFCRLENDPDAQLLGESLHDAVRQLHRKHCLAYCYAPLSQWLAQADVCNFRPNQK